MDSTIWSSLKVYRSRNSGLQKVKGWGCELQQSECKWYESDPRAQHCAPRLRLYNMEISMESYLTDTNSRLYNWARPHTEQAGRLFCETKTEYFVFEPPDVRALHQASNHQASNSIQYPHTTSNAGGIVGSTFDQVLHVVEAIWRNGCYSNKAK